VLAQGTGSAFGATAPSGDLSNQEIEAAFVLGLTHSHVEVTEFALSTWESQVLVHLAEIHQLKVDESALEAKALAAHGQAVAGAVDQYMAASAISPALRYVTSPNTSQLLQIEEYTNVAASVLEAKRSWYDAQAASDLNEAKKIDALITQGQLGGLVTVDAAVQAEAAFDAARTQVTTLASTPSPAAASTPAPATSTSTTSTTTTTTAPPTTTTTTTMTTMTTTTTTTPGKHTKPTTPGTTEPTTTSTIPASSVVPATPPATTFAPDNPVVLPTATPDLQGLSILGPVMLNAAQIAGWYRSVAHSNITKTTPLQLAHLYLDESAAEGVRGDVAFAQAMIETAGFSITSGANNFAGIGACDSCAHGYSFPSVRMGVRAQIELLKAYATPFFTEETTARPAAYQGIDTLSVRGKEPTWDSLSGVWSSGTSYGQDVLAVYHSMVTWALAHPGG
jgi:hypothetical protein